MQITNRLIVLALLLCGLTTTLAAQKVVIAETQGGTVTVDNPNAAAGETVTLTVTPDNGYEIRKAGVTAEATIDPGYAHAPRLMETGPTVGLYIELVGDDPSDLGQERTYTFTMPESPLTSAQLTISQCITLTCKVATWAHRSTECLPESM